MGNLQRVAPIFAVSDLDVALAHYRRLGFQTRVYAGGGYGYAARDSIELHLGVVAADRRHPGSAYLFVTDAEQLADEWRGAGVVVHGPEDTAWGQREGAVVDPDGNVIRFGAPTAP
jgi:catechol 2,3-dioxygenase-like lactoylglutathione lyase family enzyme